jgi:hypothetical protein
LVYSIGLIDYFSDRFVVSLLDYIHGLLKPGGSAILGTRIRFEAAGINMFTCCERD